MSMMMCERCDAFIDTDYDVECFVGDRCICVDCQMEMFDDGELIDVDGEFVFPATDVVVRP